MQVLLLWLKVVWDECREEVVLVRRVQLQLAWWVKVA